MPRAWWVASLAGCAVGAGLFILVVALRYDAIEDFHYHRAYEPSAADAPPWLVWPTAVVSGCLLGFVAGSGVGGLLVAPRPALVGAVLACTPYVALYVPLVFLADEPPGFVGWMLALGIPSAVAGASVGGAWGEARRQARKGT